jgi:hypothetical protein
LVLHGRRPGDRRKPSARASTVGGTSSPRALTVLMSVCHVAFRNGARTRQPAYDRLRNDILCGRLRQALNNLADRRKLELSDGCLLLALRHWPSPPFGWSLKRTGPVRSNSERMSTSTLVKRSISTAKEHFRSTASSGIVGLLLLPTCKGSLASGCCRRPTLLRSALIEKLGAL